ncbi:MAG: hypothetical protein PG981_000748 [Wolbachia endosymbiont of Ctenocephalides orientis wCori]|nr:MAG: hypothetical protein PG981_000748 [Wolbachia endosymbiont of Ctenocephalides orientis wCori]
MALSSYMDGSIKGINATTKKRRDRISINIGLPILIALCIANLVHFIYSEYSGYVKFVEQEQY